MSPFLPQQPQHCDLRESNKSNKVNKVNIVSSERNNKSCLIVTESRHDVKEINIGFERGSLLRESLSLNPD